MPLSVKKVTSRRLDLLAEKSAQFGVGFELFEHGRVAGGRVGIPRLRTQGGDQPLQRGQDIDRRIAEGGQGGGDAIRRGAGLAEQPGNQAAPAGHGDS
jgi:hypothetical protein